MEKQKNSRRCETTTVVLIYIYMSAGRSHRRRRDSSARHGVLDSVQETLRIQRLVTNRIRKYICQSSVTVGCPGLPRRVPRLPRSSDCTEDSVPFRSVILRRRLAVSRLPPPPPPSLSWEFTDSRANSPEPADAADPTGLETYEGPPPDVSDEIFRSYGIAIPSLRCGPRCFRWLERLEKSSFDPLPLAFLEQRRH